MRLNVTHRTSYHYDQPVEYALQQLRLMPKDSTGQTVIDWQTEIDGGKKEVTYTDQHRNHVDLVSFEAQTQNVTITCKGEVDVTLADGVVGRHVGLAPLWMFLRPTKQTKPGPRIRKLASSFSSQKDKPIELLHALSASITERVPYKIGETEAVTTAEEALSKEAGVCQDHAHIFISTARLLGIPTRYVSGYLMMNDRVEQDASHAWAEAHIDGLGWVGFDVSNSISPDERYIRVATGLDYAEAAPISGMRFGENTEDMIVNLQVQQ